MELPKRQRRFNSRRNHKIRSLVAILAIATSGSLVAVPAAANTSAGGPQSPVNSVDIDFTNLELVTALPPLEKCLFDMTVYPSGGVGYKDSSLPYDDFDPLNAALLTFRAQVMRNNVDVVMGVGQRGKGAVEDVDVIVDSRTENIPQNVTELLHDDAPGAAALEFIQAQGISVNIVAKPAPVIRRICEIRDSLHSLRDPLGQVIGVYTEPNLESGAVRVATGERTEQAVREAAVAYGSDVEVVVEEIEATSRSIDSRPWKGGNRIDSCGGSSSFRVAGNTLLTANHCAGSTFTNNGRVMGQRYGSLIGANIDAVLIAAANGDFSGTIYVGGIYSNTTVPASGVFPISGVSYGAQLLVSGASSGQGGVSYIGLENRYTSEPGCTTSIGNLPKVCQLHQTQASPGVCKGGDSGGPVGVFAPSEGRVISIGIITAATENAETDYHKCFFTYTDAIRYLYGGATIG